MTLDTPAQPRSRRGPIVAAVAAMVLAVVAVVGLCAFVSVRGNDPEDGLSQQNPAVIDDHQYIVEFIQANADAAWRDEIDSVELVAFSRLEIRTGLTGMDGAIEVCEAGRTFLRELARERYGDEGSDDVRVLGYPGRLAEATGGPCRPYQPQ